MTLKTTNREVCGGDGDERGLTWRRMTTGDVGCCGDGRKMSGGDENDDCDVAGVVVGMRL